MELELVLGMELSLRHARRTGAISARVKSAAASALHCSLPKYEATESVELERVRERVDQDRDHGDLGVGVRGREDDREHCERLDE